MATGYINIQLEILTFHTIMNLTDFGVEHLVDVKESTNFPWLMSNVIDKKTNKPLGEGLVKHTIEWEGRMVNSHAH